MNYNNTMQNFNMQNAPMQNLNMQNAPMQNFNMQNVPMQNLNMQNIPMQNMQNIPMPMGNNMNSMGSINTTYNPNYIPDASFNKKKVEPESFKNNDKLEKKKIYWIYILKAIACYTLLFMIMNHINMDNMICKFIPFICTNVVLSTVIKGVLMSIFILIIQIFLK